MTDILKNNPLLHDAEFPDFAAIAPHHVEPAMTSLLAECRATLARVAEGSVSASFEGVLQPLMESNARMSRAWSAVTHLNAVVQTPAWREAHDAIEPLVVAYQTEVAQHAGLYARLKALQSDSSLNAEQRPLVEHMTRDFKLSGAELVGEAKQAFAKDVERLSALTTAFDNNVLDVMNDWQLTLDHPTALAGLPESEVAAARERAKADGKPGYKVTLQTPSLLPVLQYANDRSLRETVYRAQVTRGSSLHNPAKDNAPLIDEVLRLRARQAAQLGFKNFAEVSVASKMAKSPAEVLQFIRDLAKRGKPYAERDMADLRTFAREKLGYDQLNPWDVAYTSEKLREANYAYSENEVKQYFQEPRVLSGLYGVIKTLYGVTIVERTASVWTPTVRFYEVQSPTGDPIGHFYLDLHARSGKQGGAWAEALRQRARGNFGRHTPLAFLTCNFSPPVGNKPALLSHDDVITLFHEFGHGLHVLLSQVNQMGISGWQGVEWDAVELPSQFMENFCWEWSVVESMTAHVDTGAPLPRALFDKMLAAKNFQAGMQLMRQLEFGLLDMRLHTESRSVEADVLATLREVRAEISVFPYADFDRMPFSFSHIFAGGYAAGYYSYKWAEVLSADTYAAFEERGGANRELGERFLREILGRGGTRSASENFRAFRGRPAQLDALLRHNGMTA